MADAYLRTHRPARTQYRTPRRATPSGVVVMHTAENTPDHVAFDGGAEAVARWELERTTPGSYHELVDSDSYITLVRWTDEAFHDGTGTNPHSFGLSIATRADVWPLAPARWRAGAVEQAAQRAAAYARWCKATHGVTIPARRISAAQARARVPGFVTHGELDPERRHDPGAGFPWAAFLERYAELVGQRPGPGTPDNPTGDDDMLTDKDREQLLAGAFLTRLLYETLNPNGLTQADADDGVRGGKAKPVGDLWRWGREGVLIDRKTNLRTAQLLGKVDGLTKALEALGAGQGIGPAQLEAITAAAEAGTQAALDQLPEELGEGLVRVTLEELAEAAKLASEG